MADRLERCGLPVQGGRGLRGGLLRLGGVQDLAAAIHCHDVRGASIIHQCCGTAAQQFWEGLGS
jgi:hypothetical protein